MENSNSTPLDAHEENGEHVPDVSMSSTMTAMPPNSTMSASEILEDMAPEVTPPEPTEQVTGDFAYFSYYMYVICHFNFCPFCNLGG